MCRRVVPSFFLRGFDLASHGASACDVVPYRAVLNPGWYLVNSSDAHTTKNIEGALGVEEGVI